jgi:hypothetical protein
MHPGISHLGIEWLMFNQQVLGWLWQRCASKSHGLDTTEGLPPSSGAIHTSTSTSSNCRARYVHLPRVRVLVQSRARVWRGQPLGLPMFEAYPERQRSRRDGCGTSPSQSHCDPGVAGRRAHARNGVNAAHLNLRLCAYLQPSVHAANRRNVSRLDTASTYGDSRLASLGA